VLFKRANEAKGGNRLRFERAVIKQRFPSEGLARQRRFARTVRGTGFICIAQISRIDDANAGATPLQQIDYTMNLRHFCEGKLIFFDLLSCERRINWRSAQSFP
jgi:hypothetical protein